MRSALTIFLALFHVSVLAADWTSFRGTVVGVIDGDTVDVLTTGFERERIRLAGIDAPEKKQAYGQRAKQHLSGLAFGRQVEVEWDKRDRYGRIVGRVLINGRDANLQMVQAGMAWWYKSYAHEQPPDDRERYAEAEEAARKKGQGLWADSNPVPPWEFRPLRKQRGRQ